MVTNLTLGADFDTQFRQMHLQRILDEIGDPNAAAADGTSLAAHYVARSRNPDDPINYIPNDPPEGNLRNFDSAILDQIKAIGAEFTSERYRALSAAVGSRVLALLREEGESGFFAHNEVWIRYWRDN